MVIDGLGNSVKEGDILTVSLGGELMVGQVVKIEEGNLLIGNSLTKDGATATKQQPYLVLNLTKPIFINEKGVVVGALKVQTPTVQ